MALGLRPNIACDADEDLTIETQIADANNPRQQFQVTLDGQVVSVRCPEKVLTNMLGFDGTSCASGSGLQLKNLGGYSESCKNMISERGTWCTHTGSKIDQVMCGNSEHLHCSDTKGNNSYMDCATGATPSTCIEPTNRSSTTRPSNKPTNLPSTTRPSNKPNDLPSTTRPSNKPTNRPSTTRPSNKPTNQPSAKSGPRGKCFESKSELEDAIAACSSSDSSDCTLEEYGPINSWCFEDSVNDMSKLFKSTTTFNKDIGGWDVSRVTNMAFMFTGCKEFNQDISRWDVSKVNDMGYMFNWASNFNQDLSGWDVSRVTKMNSMFYQAKEFNQDIGGWDVSKVTDMSVMFGWAYNFNQDIGRWNVGKVTTMSHMFLRSRGFNQDLSQWNIGRVQIFRSVLYGASNFNQDLCAWGYIGFPYETSQTMFGESGCANKTNPTEIARGPFCSSGCPARKCFESREELNDAIAACLSSDSSDCTLEEYGPINSWCFGDSVNDMSSLFKDTTFNEPINGWDVSKVTDMRWMFKNADNFNQDISRWDVSKVEDMAHMFAYTDNFNQDLSEWNISSVKDMSEMFYQAKEFNQNLCAWGDQAFPYNKCQFMFYAAGCTIQSFNPRESTRGPFCSSDCTTSLSISSDTNRSAAPSLEKDESSLLDQIQFVSANDIPQDVDTVVVDTYKSAEFRHLPSGPAEDSFATSNLRYSGKKSNLQRWKFDKDTERISNVACPDLAISSSKQKDVSLNSIYFALQNPRTQLAIGLSSESCEDGMTLTMQDLVYGSPNQQFIYIEADKKIVSLKCPEYAITIPNDDCETTESLLMSPANQNVNDRNKWIIDDNEMIQSVQCPNKFVTIHGASSGGARLVTKSKKLLVEEEILFGGPPKQSDATNSPTHKYTDKPQEVKTEWDPATPPSVGSTVILSNLNAERYQKWTKQRQLFHPLMGPFSVVNPNIGLAMVVDGSTCSNGLSLSSATTDHTSIRQQFYLGQHGSIFSAQCPGLVLAADNSTENFSVALEIFQMNQKKLKWKFANGMVESVSNSGMVLARNPDDNKIILKSNSTSSSDVKWIRMNALLLASNSATSDSAISGWKQDWKISFIDPEYKGPSVTEFIQKETASNIKCYDISSTFSASFDDFAKELVVNDASDEDQCRKVREQLGFDKDHQFDVEVRDNFYQHQCDPFFTGVDHTSGNDMEALSAPPKFEMVEYTPVEYEAVEYEEEEYVTIDYEEFSKGDDLGELPETKWPDLYIPKAGLGDLSDLSDDDDPAENQDSLVAYEDTITMLGHFVLATEKMNDLVGMTSKGICDMMPGNICAGPVCFTNPAKPICGTIYLVVVGISYVLLLALEITVYVMEDNFDTLGVDKAIYGYYYSRANYHNTKQYNMWNEKALDAIRLNMKNQHTEMKRQLQERHKDIANHVGQDIADSQNALGQAIVDAQNDIGQRIVDAQNALGQGIVDSQNAIGQDIVDTSNYITKQHNVLSEWLHENLCVIYKALNGNCARAIGPLQENQAHIPMQLYWPEGQHNIMEKIDQIQTTLPNLALEGVDNANVSSHGGLNTIKGKIDTLSSYVNENAKQVDAVDSKVDAVDNKVDALSDHIQDVDGKVDAVQDELRELKDMMAKMMGMMMN